MKKLLLLTVALCATFSSFCKGIDSLTARNVAKTFYANKAANIKSAPTTLSLVYACPAGASNTTGSYAYYIFNVNGNEGFVIVSGDDIVKPILGYSNRGGYNASNHSPSFIKWIDGYKQQITYAINNAMQPTVDITTEWSDLVNNKATSKTRGTGVNPLVQTTWDQQPNYNADCPYDNTAQKNCVTGCPATAMAQIMKYWNYPTTGSGIHSYNTASYGTLTADFGSTTYNWASMPNNISGPNADIATLMFHCGVSVEMDYGPNESGGWVITAENAVCSQSAYVTYFGYNATTIQGVQRSNYTDADWKTLLTTELDNSRPIQYAGFGTQGGHTWVCDGYDANGMFDMNWGWSGIDDGYYDINALNPGTLGTGGGAGGFNSGEVAVIGIEPVTGGGGGGGTVSGDITLYSSITIAPNPINYDQSFTVNADVQNAGTTNFNGTFSAALFDNAGNFITFIDSVVTGSTPLAPGYHYTNGLTFSNAGLLTVPGTYQVGIFYRPTGGTWYLAGNTSYTNPVSVTIAGPLNNNLQLYSVIAPTPTVYTQGQAASVNVNIYNSGSSTYYGEYEAVLLNLNDGSLVSTIGLYNETNGLPAGYDYTSPYITFSTSSLTAPPGTYILAIAEYDNTASTWYYLGTNYDTNPIYMQVVADPLSPDIYEPDNSAGTAYTLPVSWTGNAAHVVTTGSNIHIDSDIDYYDINLPTGYVYTINTTVYDKYSPSSSYTNAVLWSYDDGSGWSSAYDDASPQVITVKGAGIVTFLVSSEFPGTTGSYVLDMQITRVAGNGINNINAANIPLNVYPNPANTMVSINNPGNVYFNEIHIINAIGETVKTIKPTLGSVVENIDISDLSDGFYYIQAINDKQKYLAKFVVAH